MVWIRLCISCLAFLSVAGAIACGLVRAARSFHRIENPGMLSVLYKTALMLYWLVDTTSSFEGVQRARIASDIYSRINAMLY